ncbi:tetratricopeptide repeat protein [Agriterribacter sp.]|uniref:tetratricopeptide repeat protein n=1 Tax=Agriterribacter sp. TaxID=2821509 RepID=UPI002C3C6462|nr:tetratricopeptide repeat protein [Agriterribacter sp.]HRP55837.1 tetratricopeptide repeat protein [Agriterribacter sp.]
MIRTIVSAGMLLYCISATAQQRELDSLIRVLSMYPQRDTTRVDLLNDIAYAYYNIDPEQGLQIADSAIALALQISPQRRLASAYSNKGSNYWAKGNDSLAMIMYKKALHIYESSDYKKGRGIMYNNIGLLYFNKSDFFEAITWHQKGLEIFTLLNDSLRMASIQNNLGVDYQYISDYPTALAYYFSALAIYEQKKGKYLVGSSASLVLPNIGLVYKDLGQYDSALIYQNQSLEAFRALNSKQGMASAYGNIGVIYDLKAQPDRAISYHLKALELNEVSGNQRRMASDYTNLGAAHLQLHNYEKSYEYLTKARIIYEESGDRNNLALSLLKIGELYQHAPVPFFKAHYLNPHDRYPLAIRIFQKALKIAREINVPALQSEALESLSEVYETVHDPAKALLAYKEHVTLRDSVLDQEKRVDIAQKIAAFEFEKKAILLKAEHSKAAALAGAEIKRQRIIRNTLAAGTIVILLGAFAGYIAYKRRRDAEEERKDIEFKARVAETEMKALRAQMNPHFIFNSLNSIADYIGKNDIPEAGSYLTKFAKLMRVILENSEQKEVPLADDLKALELYMQLEAKRLNNAFTYSIMVNEDIDRANTLVPPLLLQPFVENSIWHGLTNKKGEGKIMIRITLENGMLSCVVEDNGVGMPQTIGADNGVHAEKKSLGMKITRERIEVINETKHTNASIASYDLAGGVRTELKLPLEMAF